MSPDGKILDCNNIAIETLGYSRDELIGMPLFDIYSEESKPYAKEFFKEWLKTGKLRNKELSEELWGISKKSGQTWEFIFFVKINSLIRMSKRTLLSHLGYKENDPFRGNRRVTEKFLESYK